MATVNADLVQSSALTYDDSGYRLTRTYAVEGVTGDANARMYNAITAAGLPARGDAHPVIPGIQVLRLSCDPEMEDSSQFLVTVEYGELPAGEIADEKTAAAGTVLDKRLGARLGPKRAVNKNDGNPITDSEGSERNVMLEQSELTFSFSRVVASLATAAANGSTFLNSVNQSAWNGYAPRTWRALSMDATPIDGRTDGAVRESWELVHNPEAWDYVASWYLNGLLVRIASIRVYSERDFSLFGVTI